MRRVNVPLLIAIALLLIGGVAGTYVLHRFQVRRNAEDMARQAKRQIDEGNDDEAIRLLSRYVALRPDDAPRQREYAELLLRQVDAGKATPRLVGATVAALEVAVRKAPDANDLREKLANLLARIGDADSIRSANEHLAMIRERRPDGEANDDTRRVDLMFAATAAQMGQFDDAEEVLAALTGFDRRTKQFDPAFQPAPGHPESFAALAEILERHRRDPKTAERIIDRMMEIAPDDVSTWKILATWRMGHKQAEAAIEAAEKARALAPDDQDVALLELRLAIVGNRLDRAAEILAGPLGDGTDSADVFAAKAYLARSKGDVDGLISILRDAVAAFPSNPAFRADLLLGLSDGKRFEDLRPLIAESQPLNCAILPALKNAHNYSRASNQMTIKSDKWIRRMAEQHGMLDPFEPNQVRQIEGRKVISYGTSSYGYDVRCSDEFKLFTNLNSTIVDPKNFDANSFVDLKSDVCIIPPNSFALARTVEYFRIPRNVLTVCLGKSTYARCGIIVNVTPLEPEWEGYVTLEFSNTTPLPAKIYANEGVAQMIFFESDADDVCETSYKDRGGKYQGQVGVTLPKI